MSKDPYKVAVGERLRVTAAEYGMETTQALADYLGVERGSVDSWLNGRALPPVFRLFRFIDDHRLTLDWFFRGDASGVPLERGIRLRGAMEGLVPGVFDADVQRETPSAVIPMDDAERFPQAPAKGGLPAAAAKAAASRRLPRS